MLKKGFTLIELLIVIVIIGILSVAVIPKVLDYPKKARDSQRIMAISSLNTAMAVWMGDNPTTALTTKTECLDPTKDLGLALKSYMANNELPKDSRPQKKYSAVSCDYYYYVLKVTDTKITDYVFVAAMESDASGNAASITWTADGILGTATINTGTRPFYIFKQTGL